MARNTRIGVLCIAVFSSLGMGAVQKEDPTDALFKAIDTGDAAKVQSLFNTSSPPDVRRANAQGMTPLLIAAEKGHADIVQVLLERGADINGTGPDKNTALHYAAQNGHISVVKVLVHNRANTQQYNAKGKTAIDLATQNGHQDVAELLRPAQDDAYGRYSNAVSDTDTAAERADLDTLNEVLKDPNEILKRVQAVPDLSKKLVDLAKACDKEELRWINAKIRIKSRFAPAMLGQINKELTLVADMAKKDSAEKTTAATKAMQTRWNKRIREVSKQMRAQLRSGGPGMGTAPVMRRTTRRRNPRRGRVSSRGARSTSGDAYANGYGDPGGMPQADERSHEEQEEERIVNNWVQADEGNMDSFYKTVHEQALTEYADLRAQAMTEEAKNTVATIDGLLLARVKRLNKSVAVIEAKKAELAAQQQSDMGMEGQRGRQMRGRGRRVR